MEQFQPQRLINFEIIVLLLYLLFRLRKCYSSSFTFNSDYQQDDLIIMILLDINQSITWQWHGSGMPIACPTHFNGMEIAWHGNE